MNLSHNSGLSLIFAGHKWVLGSLHITQNLIPQHITYIHLLCSKLSLFVSFWTKRLHYEESNAFWKSIKHQYMPPLFALKRFSTTCLNFSSIMGCPLQLTNSAWKGVHLSWHNSQPFSLPPGVNEHIFHRTGNDNTNYRLPLISLPLKIGYYHCSFPLS